MLNPDVNKNKLCEKLLIQFSLNSLTTSIAFFINIAIISIAFWDSINSSFLTIWALIISALLFFRTIKVNNYIKTSSYQDIEKKRKFFKNLNILLAIITSIGINIIFYQSSSLLQQAFLIILTASISMTIAVGLSMYKESVINSIFILIVPLALHIALQDTKLHLLTTAVLLLFLATMMIFANRYGKNIISLAESELMIEKTQLEKEDAYHQIKQQSYYDELTGLANRSSLNEKLKQKIEKLYTEKKLGALLFINLDNFKTINNSLGHKLGDKLLQDFAKRALSVIRKEDMIARINADEFVILLDDEADSNAEIVTSVSAVAENLHSITREPIKIQSNKLHITVSVGIHIIGLKEENIHDILKNADIAVNKAKELGRATTCFFEEDMCSEVEEELQLNSDIHQALKQDQFELYYQPIIETKNSQISSCEALIRWKHPQKGLLYPDAFIDYAEKSGLIVPIGDWVIKTACKEFKKYQNKLNNIAINISSKQFNKDDFVTNLLKVTQEYDVEPKCLKLELTESVVINNYESTINKMKLLKSHGFIIAMDDFGTGYSSLSYLKNLPFDSLKIDRSFIQHVLENEDDATLVKTILSISRQFNFKVIAEGVETDEHIKFLKSINCDYYQGYVVSKPIPSEEFQRKFISAEVS